ncbi:MAG: carboxypeptidase-like regulatory domain-containing protein [Niastella sp.]|nr:carboxypeptidase-like regulatory domain-containing protein [Niastella sp.]
MISLIDIRKVLALFFFFACSFVFAQGQTVVRGVIRDAQTHAPLAFVSVYFKGNKGVVSDEDGRYSISTTNPKNVTLQFSFAGYKVQSKTIVAGTTQDVDIALELEEMEAVVVNKRRRTKYSNKNNPAVDLIRKVVDNRDRNRMSAADYLQYQQYEKMELSLTNKPEKLMNSRLLKNYKFLVENQDTSKIEGKSLVPVYIEETISNKYYRKDPRKEKTYVLAKKKVNLGEFVDNDGITRYLNSMYMPIDIYEPNITLLSNQLLSPISDLAPTFYRFYLRDTIELDGIKLVRLNFAPRNPNDLLFRGMMYVTLDSNYAVQKIQMELTRHANLNWTRELRIKQDFERGTDGRYHVVMSDILSEFALSKKASGGLVGERSVSYKDYVINQPGPDSVYQGKAEVIVDAPASTTDSFWTANRHTALSSTEAKAYTNMDSLQNMKSYRRLMDWATFLLAGYKAAGPYEIGPVNAFYSFNPVEGFRLRFGGRTTPKFSKRLYFENYVAYGFKDEKVKYFLSGAYSFNGKSIYSYPLNFIRLGFQHDTKIPGQELQFVQEDNFLLSFKRGDNNRWLYNDIFTAEYVREFGKNFRYTFGFKNWKQQAAGSIIYQKPNGSDVTTIPDITTTELSAELRWAPNEQFYQGKAYRIPIYNKYPIFRLRYAQGFKGLVKGDYDYQQLTLNIFKRFYLSQFGYADVVTEGGYTFGQLPYPLLTIHRANQSYAYQLNSFNMMNFMEFVSDHYVSVSTDYYFNGFIFNKLPLIKKLKLREVAGFKLLYGGVRKENNPAYNNNTFLFPKDEDGTTTTFSLGNKPYMEANVGIGNIFKVLRVDLVKRLSYLENPDAPNWGIRARVKFDF